MAIRVGLDIGIASVGWCVIEDEEQEILGLGVRTFTKAEDPKTGDSLARPRRMARSVRRRLRRRRVRMERLRDLFVLSGLITREGLETVYVVGRESKTPYELRAEGLDRRLSGDEWVRVLTQLGKRRGFKSMRLSETVDEDEGIVKEAISANRLLMQEKGYRTAGEMLALDERFAESQRNRGDYKGVMSRELLLQEVATLFSTQRNLGSPFASAEIEAAYVDLVTWQAAIMEGEALLALVGLCDIDGKHRRIARACPTFERFRFLDKLHNVRYTLPPDYERHALNDEQRDLMLAKAYVRRTGMSYGDVRKYCDLPTEARFVGVRYGREVDGLSAEKKEKLPHPKAWHEIAKRVGDAGPAEWVKLSEDAELLDRVAETLTYYKLEASIRRELADL